MPKPKPKQALCHPGRPHCALNLCKPCYERRHRATNVQAYRQSARRYVWKKYGLTPEQFDTMFQASEGLCRICRLPMLGRSLYVDHDHMTGTVRGLLCRECNSGLGFFKDSSYLLRQAEAYLASA